MEGIPQNYTSLVGTEQIFSGGLFSSKRDEPEAKYNVLNVRWGSAKICDMKTMKMKHPTVEYLIKNGDMKKARWTRPFPVREITLEDDND